MTKHTPGPWKVSGKPSICGYKVAEKSGRSVASFPATSKRSDDEREANARLIAEAPAMLDVIKELLRGHQADIEDYGPEDDVYRAHDAAHAIISRIGGGE